MKRTLRVMGPERPQQRAKRLAKIYASQLSGTGERAGRDRELAATAYEHGYLACLLDEVKP